MTLDSSPTQPETSPSPTPPRRPRRGRAGAALTGLATVVALWFGLAAPTVSPVAAPSVSAAQLVEVPIVPASGQPDAAVADAAVAGTASTNLGSADAATQHADEDGDHLNRSRDDGGDRDPGGQR